jgi:hypothetical protein
MEEMVLLTARFVATRFVTQPTAAVEARLGSILTVAVSHITVHNHQDLVSCKMLDQLQTMLYCGDKFLLYRLKIHSSKLRCCTFFLKVHESDLLACFVPGFIFKRYFKHLAGILGRESGS